MNSVEEIQSGVDHILYDLEQSTRLSVLQASAIGSKARGTETELSDVDVRFIYVRPMDWYMSIDVETRPSTLEPRSEWDVVGMDLRKALVLIGKSNPDLYDVLNSPIVYREDSTVVEGMKNLYNRSFNPNRFIYYHFGMGKKNLSKIGNAGKEDVKISTYLHAARSVFSADWVYKNRTPPPILFGALMDGVDIPPRVRDAVASLLELRHVQKTTPKVHVMDRWLEDNVFRDHRIIPCYKKPEEIREELNSFFLRIVTEYDS